LEQHAEEYIRLAQVLFRLCYLG